MLARLPQYWFNKVAKTQRRQTTVTDGSVATDYNDYLIGVRMRFVPAAGGENGGQDRLNTQDPFSIYLEGAPDVRTTDRIIFDGRVFDISSINNYDQANVYTGIRAIEVQPAKVGA